MMRRVTATLAGSVLVFASLGFSHSRSDGIRRAEDLEHAAARFSSLLERHNHNLGLIREARKLASHAAHFAEMGNSNRRHRRQDFREVAQAYYRVRDRFHGDFHFRARRVPENWYLELMKSWVNVVYSYQELANRVSRGPRRDFPSDPIDDRGVREITVRCKSHDYRPNQCRVNGTILEVYVEDQRSRAACVEGHSFGFRGNALWVDEGCDARFRVVYRR